MAIVEIYRGRLLSAKFRSKDPGIVGMLWAVNRKSVTQLSAKFRSKDPGVVGML